MWNLGGESRHTTHADWIKNNMFGDTCTVNTGRPLTDAEIRFQKCLEQLPVPSWYLTYSKKKPSIRINCIPLDKRHSTWKNVKPPVSNNQRKSPKKWSSKSSPKTSDSESPVNSRADSGFNETYSISRRTLKNNKNPCISISSSSSDDEQGSPTSTNQDKALAVDLSLNRTPRQPSFTFPRVTPSRKIENLNIIFEKPFPPRDDEPQLSIVATEPRTVYTKTKNIEVCPCDSSTSNATRDEMHTTFLIADVNPGGVHPRVHVSAGIATPSPSSSSSSSDEEAAKAAQPNSPSPNTRFFTSRKKSTALEKIVQGNLGNPRGNLVQQIIGELEQSAASAPGDEFVRSMVSALEESFAGNAGECREKQLERELDRELESDSELAKSVDISMKSSGGEESPDEQPTTPLPHGSSPGTSDSAESEEEVYWIPTWMSNLPRTSSRLNVPPRVSGRNNIGTADRNSPGLSPIRRECPENWLIYPMRGWGYTYNTRKKRSPQPLFRIDETGNLDSGYSGTTSSRRTAPSRSITATIGSANTRCNDRHAPNASLASSSNLAEREVFNDALHKSGPRTTMHGSFSLSSRSKSTTDVFRASTCIDDASYPPVNYPSLSRSNSRCRKGSVSSPARGEACSLPLGHQAEQLKRSRSYLTEDIRRQFEFGFEASVARKAAGETPSPHSHKSRVIVKRLVEALEGRHKESVPPEAGFQNRAPKSAPLSKDDRNTVPGTKERQHVFQERYHTERVFSRMPSKLEKLREEEGDSEYDDFPDSEDDLPARYNAWGSELIIPSKSPLSQKTAGESETPSSSKFSARRTLKNVFSSLKSWRVGGSAKSLPKGTRDYYAARESLGEEMRAFRRDTMPRLMEHAEVKVRLPAKQEKLRQREQNREFVELINSPALAPEDTPPSIATIHPVYGSKAAATQNRRSLKLNEEVREVEEVKPEVIYRSKRVMSPEAPMTENLLRPSTVRDLQKRLSDSADAVQLRRPMGTSAPSTAPIVYDVPRSNRRVSPLPPTASEAYTIRLEPRQRFTHPEYENLSGRISDDKRLQCTAFTTF